MRIEWPSIVPSRITYPLAMIRETLNLMFSMPDIVKVMGPHSAAFVQMSKDVGTLEVGKLADIVMLPANPLDGY
jgi:imidazolonepropionase-like amidohydrolase